MDGVEPTKRRGRATTQQSDRLGDPLLQFMLSPPTLPGQEAHRSQCKWKASSAIMAHFAWSHPRGIKPFHVTMKLN